MANLSSTNARKKQNQDDGRPVGEKKSPNNTDNQLRSISLRREPAMFRGIMLPTHSHQAVNILTKWIS